MGKDNGPIEILSMNIPNKQTAAWLYTVMLSPNSKIIQHIATK
jgi:hypothetical protein